MSVFKKNNLTLINAHCRKMLPRWRKTISPNIVGVHVGKKSKQGKSTNKYAIVFHVAQKLAVPVKNIPAVIKVKTPDGVLEVPTDVIETGYTRLLTIMSGDRAKPINITDNFGTVGLFFKRNSLWYVCSNMHVLAPHRLAEGSYSRPIPKQEEDVVCFNQDERTRAFLEKASFRGTDLAIARMDDQSMVDPGIKEVGTPKGIINSANLRPGNALLTFGAASNQVLTGVVKATNVMKLIQYDSIETIVHNLVQTSIPVIPGDSGSPVVTDSLRVAGIIISSDNGSSYVIPAEMIISFVKPD